MSTPSCIRPQRQPKPDVTGPLTGQMKPELPPWIGPAGSGVVAVSVAAWICASILPWMAEMSPSRWSMSELTWSSAAAFWSRAASRSASRASSCDRVRSSSAFLAAISSRSAVDPVDGLPSAVAKRAHAADDRRVLLLDPSQVLVSGHEVVEAVGLEHHGDHVGLPGR